MIYMCLALPLQDVHPRNFHTIFILFTFLILFLVCFCEILIVINIFDFLR